MLFGGEEKSVACSSVGSLQDALRKLDNREPSECRLNSPRSQGRSRAKDGPLSIDERDVDRELHEERVDAVTRREDERSVRREAGATEEALIAGLAVECALDESRHDVLMAGVAKNPGCLRGRENRVQEPQDSFDCRVIL
jgi:hypothetical protein